MDTLRMEFEAQKGVSQIVTPLLQSLNYIPASSAEWEVATLAAGESITIGATKVLLVVASAPVNIQADALSLTGVRCTYMDQAFSSVTIQAIDSVHLQVLKAQ